MIFSISAKEMFSSCAPMAALVDGVKIGCGNCCASFNPGGQRNAADHSRLLIVLPARAGDVAAHDRFDRQRLELPHHQRAAFDLVALVRRNHGLGSDASRWFGMTCASLPNQKFDMAVNT